MKIRFTIDGKRARHRDVADQRYGARFAALLPLTLTLED